MGRNSSWWYVGVLAAVVANFWMLSGATAAPSLPLVINTWPFVDANVGAVQELKGGGSALDAVEKGCSVCEVEQCDGSVGYGGSPDEKGETTLDAMIMDGETHSVGSVGCLKDIRSAISVARNVLNHTQQTLLVGEDATNFAVSMGFKRQNLTTNKSREIWEQWKEKNCQPNYWKPGTVSPDPTKSCGPYSPVPPSDGALSSNNNIDNSVEVDRNNHDTIAMVAIEEDGRIACGTSTNGLTYKIPGRVGDSPFAGAGCYVESGVGGAGATGDGDVMMRFLPTYQAVQSMKAGMTPTQAAKDALQRIQKFYPDFVGAMIAVNTKGEYGGANHGFSPFRYTVYTPQLGNSTVVTIQ